MKKKIFTFFLALVASVGISSAAITVRLDPSSCSSWSTVRLWAWTDAGNVFDSWPGQIVSKDGDGWYAYTFSSSITSVSIIWTNGTDQTVDITGVTSSTCYELDSQTGTAIKVSVVDCGSEGGQSGTIVSGKYKIGELYYNLNATDQTAEVTSQNGIYPYWSTTITTADIPASITYNDAVYSVTSIGDYAFNACSSLTSVTIPNSVTSIGDGAFSGCSGLTSVTIPNSVTSIGHGAFSGCYGLTSVIIPNSVTNIGYNAFDSCKGLTSVTIGNGVTNLDQYVFARCSGLASVSIPNSVTNIGYHTFCECTGLTSVTIPNSVTRIEQYAFAGCTSLTSVTIPNSVTSILHYAFASCTSLTSVTIGNGVTGITQEAFTSDYFYPETPKVNEIHFIGNLSEWMDKQWHASLISSAYDLYLGENKLTDLVILDGTTTVNDTFRGCTSLTSITFPAGVIILESNAFSGCSSVQTMTCYGQRPPTVKEYALDGIDYSTIVYVPAEYLETYIKHDAWGVFDVRPLDTPEAIEEIEGNSVKSNNKFFHHGQILILRGDKTYTLQGQEVK